MKKTNKHLNILINFTENLCKLMSLIKVNMNVYVIFLLNMLMKKTSLFNKYDYKKKNKFFWSK